ncbi:MAG: hypothetical protein HY226_02870 [Candidatus Vogelbacteria bacterium]|nr:hypothetical protein [Candidatus Vogelbacteria bacterium]
MDPNKLPMSHNNIEEGAKIDNVENRKELPKITVQSKEQAVDLVLRSFDMKLKERFTEAGKTMGSKEYQEYLAFHGPEHSEKVERWTVKFLETVRAIDPYLVSPDTLRLAKPEARGHDLIQWAMTEQDMAMRMRARGAEEGGKDIPANVIAEANKRSIELPGAGNERASAEEIVAELRRFIDHNGTPVFNFTNESVYNDISMTLPGFNFGDFKDSSNPNNPKNPRLPKASGGTIGGPVIFQPKLTLDLSSLPEDPTKWQKTLEDENTREVSITGLAIASADLRGELASDNSEDFRQSGDAEFRETMIGIGREVENWKEIPQVRREQIAQSILGWKKSQIVFAKWQRIFFITSIDQNKVINSSSKADEIKNALFRTFGLPENDAVYKEPDETGNFGKNIKAAEEHSKSLEAVLDKYEGTRAEKITLAVKDDTQFSTLLKSIGYNL